MVRGELNQDGWLPPQTALSLMRKIHRTKSGSDEVLTMAESPARSRKSRFIRLNVTVQCDGFCHNCNVRMTITYGQNFHSLRCPSCSCFLGVFFSRTTKGDPLGIVSTPDQPRSE